MFGASVAWAQQAAAPAPAPAPPAEQAVAAPVTPATPAAPVAPVAPAPAPREWVDEVKNPVPWFKWGADLRLRQEYFNNAITLDDEVPGHEFNYQRYRARVWGTVTPIENLDLNTRFTWEGRHWVKPDTREEWDWSDVIIDTLNVKVSNMFDAPLSTTVGRQDIILGDGWLVLEGTPLDGSRTIYFDAVRVTYGDKTTENSLDLIYINNLSDTTAWLPTIGNDDIPLMEQDERGAIVYLTNKSIEDTQISPYFMYKHNEPVLATGDEGDIYTFGTRVAHDFDEHWKGRVEGAYQFGERENILLPNGGMGDLQAWGLNSRLTYHFNDELKNQIRLSFEHLSGDDPDTLTNEQFVPLWGRWPQWSDLWVFTDASEFRIAETTNLDRLGIGWQANPTQKMELGLDYHALFANQNTYEGRPGFSDDGLFRGHLFTGVVRYRFNRFLIGALQGEYLFPGNYYSSDRRDDAVFLRAELVVTF